MENVHAIVTFLTLSNSTIEGLTASVRSLSVSTISLIWAASKLFFPNKPWK